MNFFSYILILSEKLKGRNENKNKFVRRCGLVRYYVISWFENLVVRYSPMCVCYINKCQREEKIVVSLTTFPARINACFYTIKTLLLQTMRPDRVVLWLADEQFPEHKLPNCYDKLVTKGLEIKYCQDLKSHKKYFYALQEQKPDELVITFDDDIIYNPLSVERAYKKHLQFPKAIVANETKIIVLDAEGIPQPYSNWKKAPDGNNKPDILNSVMSGSGCLYPYNIWPNEMFDIKLHQKLAPTADDLWITFYAKYCNIPIVCVDTPARNYTTVRNSQESHLAQINCLATGNDDTIRAMLNNFTNINLKPYNNNENMEN